jgi:hypothetical protein
MQHNGMNICTARAALDEAVKTCSDGAVRLARMLCAHCETRSRESLLELEKAVRSYAADFRLRDEPPEKLVIALKKVFARMDGHAPSLVSLQSFRDAPLRHAGCCDLYRSTLAQCIDAYFTEPTTKPE